MSKDDDIAAMRRDLVHDLGQAVRDAQAQAAQTQANVRDPAWTHRPSDDFPGCTE